MDDENRPEDLVTSDVTTYPGFLFIKFSRRVRNSVKYSVQVTQKNTPLLTERGLHGTITGRLGDDSSYTLLIPVEEHETYLITTDFDNGRRFMWVV